MGPSLLRRQFGVLERAPGFRALFLATLGSGIGTNLATIALIVDVFDRTGSGVWVAVLLIVEFLPIVVIGLLLGPLVDRFPRRTLMIASDLARFGVFVALPFAPGAGTIVALAAVAGFATGLFRPAVYAGMPNLVEEKDLPHANSLFQAVDNLTWMLGPLLGGAILAATSPDINYVINAVTFLVSAAFLLQIAPARLQVAVGGGKGHFRDLAEGFRVVRTSRALLTVLVAWTVVMIANAQVNVSEVALAKVSLDAGDFGLGLLMASSGFGLVVGSLLGGGLIERAAMGRVYGGAIAVMAVGVGAAAASPSVWVAVACVAVMGLGNGVAGVCNPVLVQRGAPDAVRGRAFTVIMSVNASMFGIAMAVAGPLTDAFGARWVWGVAAVINGAAALLAFALARGIPAPAAVEDVEAVTVVAAGAPQTVQAPEPERL